MNIFKSINFKIFTNGPLNAIETILNFKKHSYICVLASHGFSLALFDLNFNNALKNSLLNVPDGKPIALYASKIYKKRKVERVYGPDLMVSTLKRMNSLKRNKVFFLGGNEYIKNLMQIKISKLYPNINIVGFDYRVINLNKPDNALIDLVNNKNPDIVFIGLGCPKQELWMYENYKKINSLLVGVGAAFDFFVENKKQAPKLIQEIYLEWLFRLIQEPRRLFARYLKYNSIFLFHSLVRIMVYYLCKIRFKIKR